MVSTPEEHDVLHGQVVHRIGEDEAVGAFEGVHHENARIDVHMAVDGKGRTRTHRTQRLRLLRVVKDDGLELVGW